MAQIEGHTDGNQSERAPCHSVPQVGSKKGLRVAGTLEELFFPINYVIKIKKSK